MVLSGGDRVSLFEAKEETREMFKNLEVRVEKLRSY